MTFNLVKLTAKLNFIFLIRKKFLPLQSEILMAG